MTIPFDETRKRLMENTKFVKEYEALKPEFDAAKKEIIQRQITELCWYRRELEEAYRHISKKDDWQRYVNGLYHIEWMMDCVNDEINRLLDIYSELD